MTELLKDIKSLRLRNLLKDLLRHNPEERLTINEFYVKMLGTIHSRDFIAKDITEELLKKERQK